MKIYTASDHNGYEFKRQLDDFLTRSGYEITDEGNKQLDPGDDFPQFAGRAVSALLADGDPDSRAILVCASGQGMCMAANRFKGIRASLCWNVEEARSARNDDDSNVLCLSSRSVQFEQSKAIILAWMTTPFAGAPRFKRRIRELDELRQ